MFFIARRKLVDRFRGWFTAPAVASVSCGPTGHSEARGAEIYLVNYLYHQLATGKIVQLVLNSETE